MKKILTMLSTLTLTLISAPLKDVCRLDQNSYNLELGLDQSICKSISKTTAKTNADKIKNVIEALGKIEDDEIECPSSYVNGQHCSMIWDVKYAIKKFAKYINVIKEVRLKEDLSLEPKLKTKCLCSNEDVKKLTLYDWVLFDEVIVVTGTVQAGIEEENFKFTVKVKESPVFRIKMRDGVWKI